MVFASATLPCCGRAPTAQEPAQRVARPSVENVALGGASAVQGVPNAAASSSAAAIPTTAALAATSLALHVVTRTDAYAAKVYPGAEATRVLVPACVANLEGLRLIPGHYPLPGRSCREPLRKLTWSGGRQWLLAGPELWSSSAGETWQLQATLPRAEEVLLPVTTGAPGLALVVPYRQPSRSVHQVSSSFELRRLAGNAGPALPSPALAKASPSLPFDDYVGACSTKTRVATPRAFHVTATGRALVFGTECNRDDQSLASVVETWSAGKRESVIERLPFPQQDALLKVQLERDDEIWAAQAFGLLHFDGSSWTESALPEGASGLRDFSVSARGTIWLLTGNARLWQRKRGQPWQERTTSAPLAGVRAIFADGEGDLWLSTDTALFSTKALPAGELCASACPEYWQESGRTKQVPHGD